MADISPANEKPKEWARLHEQGGSASSAQSQEWAPVPTAFNTIVVTTMNTVEDETPTRPVTPLQVTNDNTTQQTNGGVIAWNTEAPSTPSIGHAQLCLLLEEENKTVSAGKPRCAICCIDFTATNHWQRTQHFNQCWSRYRNAAGSNIPDMIHLGDEGVPASICILCNKSLERFTSIDAFEHRLLCLRSLNPLPTICPRCDTHFATENNKVHPIQIVEHIYTCSAHPEGEAFENAENAWCERRAIRRNPDNCAFCSKSLTNLDIVDTLFHRRNCLQRTQPAYCPVCSEAIPSLSELWTLEDILWHVHNCQHGNTLSLIDRADYEVLEARLVGRTQAVYRLFSPNVAGSVIGPRKSWTHKEHSFSYRSKRVAGRDNALGIFLTPSTNLRSVAMYAGDDAIEIISRTRSKRAVWSNLELFRRSAFCIYRTPDYEKMPKGLRSECGTDEVVYYWYEESETVP